MSKEEKKSPSTAIVPYRPKPLALLEDGLGTLEDYIRAANRAPLLTPEREHELAVRLRDTGDAEAAGELIMTHLRLVVSIARQFQGYGLPFSDLIQEGNIGLMKAVKRFDPDRGARLVTFAMTWIKAEIQEYVIKNWRLVKIATTKSQRKLFFNLNKLKDEPRLLTLTEASKIADKLDVKTSEVFEMEERLTGGDITIDHGPDDQDQKVPEDWLSAEEDAPEQKIEAAGYETLLQTGLPQAVRRLDARSRKIIESRWLFDETAAKKGATLADLANEFGISQERVRQLEKKALATLKDYLSAHV